MTPKGPLGFPRLTTLGPLVEESGIKPHEDIEPGVYSIESAEDIQPRTMHDTKRAMKDVIDMEMDTDHLTVADIELEYKESKIGDVLEINEFSSKLLEAMSRAEERDIPLDAEVGDRGAENGKLEEQVRRHMNGESSMFTDEILSGIDMQWDLILNDGIPSTTTESVVRENIVDTVIIDFSRVVEINEKIRSSGVYYPPTTEDLSLDGIVGWGTLDGAHRLVALSQILGSDESIFIWEWHNQKEFIKDGDRIEL